MFDALDDAVRNLGRNEAIHVVLLAGQGPAFCAGFDLAAAHQTPDLLGEFILRLSALNRSIRRLPQVVVAAVHGAAIAGGCAILSACDFVVADPDARFGYPVHRIGVSPAVTIPLLAAGIGQGPARSLLMSGEIFDGVMAHRIGLVSHLTSKGETALQAAQQLALDLAKKGPHALAATKRWLNVLDASLDDAMFDDPARASAKQTASQETLQLLGSWKNPAVS